jgi:hypothetical protein
MLLKYAGKNCTWFIKLQFYVIKFNYFRHARLLSLLGKFRESIADDTKSPILAEVSHSLKLPPLTGELQLDKVQLKSFSVTIFYHLNSEEKKMICYFALLAYIFVFVHSSVPQSIPISAKLWNIGVYDVKELIRNCIDILTQNY